MADEEILVDAYSDLTCPWCFVGKRRLDAAIKELGRRVKVVYHPYIIDSRIAPTGEAYMAYNEKRWGGDGWVGDLRRSARGDGILFADWRWWPNSLNAHCLLEFALETRGWETQGELKEALYVRGYEEGANLSLELVPIAVSVGLDGAEAESALLSGRYSKPVKDAIRHAQETLVISGVPYYVINRQYALEGAQSVQTFLGALRKCR